MVTIFLFLILLGFILFASITQILWLYRIYGPNSKVNDTVTRYLIEKGINIKSIDIPKGELKRLNPIKSSLNVSIPGFFGPTAITRYLYVVGENDESQNIIIWVRISHSIFSDTKFKYFINPENSFGLN